MESNEKPLFRRITTSMKRHWPRQTWLKFCENTSMGGWVFIADMRVAPYCRLVWAIVVIVAFSLAGYLVYETLTDYYSDPLIIRHGTATASLDDLYFPGVTVCNMNQAKRSFFAQFGLGIELGQSVESAAASNPMRKNLTHSIEYVLYGTERNAGDESHESDEEHVRYFRSLFAKPEVMRKGYLVEELRRKHRRLSSFLASTRNRVSLNVSDFDPANGQGLLYFRQASVQEIGQSTVLHASYRSESLTVDELPALMHSFFATDFGFCSLIRPQHMFNKSYAEVPFEDLLDFRSHGVHQGVGVGMRNGLKLILDAETFDYGYSPQMEEGFKVSVHHPLDMPVMDLSQVDASPGFETNIGVTATVYETSKRAMSFKPHSRRCYTDDEVEFESVDSSKFRYSMRNCQLAAALDRVSSTCSCSSSPWACSGLALNCRDAALSGMGNERQARRATSDAAVTCLDACSDQRHSVSVTAAAYPNRNAFARDGTAFCLVLRKLRAVCAFATRRDSLERHYGANTCRLVSQVGHGICAKKAGVPLVAEDILLQFTQNNGSSESEVLDVETANHSLTSLVFDYARDNLAVLHVYMGDEYVERVIRDERQPFIWVMANIGGLLGVLTGFSFITLFEIIYYFGVAVSKVHKSVRESDSAKDEPEAMDNGV